MLILQFFTPYTRPTIIIHRTYTILRRYEYIWKNCFQKSSDAAQFYTTFCQWKLESSFTRAVSSLWLFFYILHIVFIGYRFSVNFERLSLFSVYNTATHSNYNLYIGPRNNTNCTSIDRYYIKHLLCKKNYCKLFAFVELSFKGQYYMQV